MGTGGLPPPQRRDGSLAAARARLPGGTRCSRSGSPRASGPGRPGGLARRGGSSPGEKESWSRLSAARGAGTTHRPETAALSKERSFIPLLDAGHNCSPDISAPVCLGPGEVQPVWIPVRCLHVRIKTKPLVDFLRTVFSRKTGFF